MEAFLQHRHNNCYNLSKGVKEVFPVFATFLANVNAA